MNRDSLNYTVGGGEVIEIESEREGKHLVEL